MRETREADPAAAAPAVTEATLAEALPIRAVLRCDLRLGENHWDSALLGVEIAGRPLLARHLLAFREVGLRRVEVHVFDDDQKTARILERCRVRGLSVTLARVGDILRQDPAEAILEQRADTLIDPRLLRQLLGREGEEALQPVECVDRYGENYPVRSKSPYKVGVPGGSEASPLDDTDGEMTWFALGLQLRPVRESVAAVRLDVGRYYWHRVQGVEDSKAATWKVLLATMKETDGIYAHTNRRVSLRISRLLVATPVTPNMATLFALLCSLFGGLLFAQGAYGYMVAASLVSWFASMFDGVDGELARARFQTSEFGCWLEMVCDYLYYVFVILGLGYGLYSVTQDWIWLFMAGGSVLGVILSFTVIARQRKQHAREAAASEFGLAFQRRVGSRAKANPLFGFLRTMGFVATRAALPYFIFVFVVLGGAKLLLGLICFGSNLAWMLSGYASRLFRR